MNLEQDYNIFFDCELDEDPMFDLFDVLNSGNLISLSFRFSLLL